MNVEKLIEELEQQREKCFSQFVTANRAREDNKADVYAAKTVTWDEAIAIVKKHAEECSGAATTTQ